MLFHDMLIGLIGTLLSEKGLRFLSAFNCWSASDNLKLMKELSANRIAINIISLQSSRLPNLMETLNSGNYSTMGVFYQFGCAGSNEVIRQCAVEKCFTQRNHWLVYEDVDTGQSSVLRELNRTRLFIDAEITFASPNGTQDDVDRMTLFDVYNNGHHIGGRLNVTMDRHYVYSRFDRSGHLTESAIDAKFKYDNRVDMRDVTLRVGTVYLTPSNRTLTSAEVLKHYMTDEPNGEEMDVLNKPSFRIAAHIQELLRYNISWSHHKRWFTNYTHGELLSELLDETIDLNYAYFAAYEYRLNLMHFIVETQALRSAFIFRTFGSQKVGLIGNVFFKPFDTTVWISLLVFVLFLAVGIHLIFLKETKFKSSGVGFAPSCFLSMLTTLGVFCQQGASIVPRSFNGRLVFISINFMSILVYTYYTTEVLSALISSPASTDIKTITQLAESSIKVRFETATYTIIYIETTKTAEMNALKEHKIRPYANRTTIHLPLDTGLNLVRGGGYAFLSDTSAAYAFIRRKFEPNELCDINEINLRPKAMLGFTAHKQSPYKEMFKTKFRKLRDFGILNRYQRIWTPGRPPCMADSIVFSVGLEYAGPLLVFLAGSMLFCLAILALEIVEHRAMAKHRRMRANRNRTASTERRMYMP